MPPEVNATEPAQKLADEKGIDLSGVGGSGSGGQITKADVEALVAAQDQAQQSVPDEPPKEPVPVYLNPATLLGGYDSGDGLELKAGERKVLSHEDYQRYKNRKVEIAGRDLNVLVKE